MSIAAKQTFEILYQTAPQWMVGWNVDDPNSVTPISSDDHYPDDYAGKIIAIKESGFDWGGQHHASCMALISLELTDAQYKLALNKDVKVKSGALADIELLDKLGQQLYDGMLNIYGSEKYVCAAQNSEDEDLAKKYREDYNTLSSALAQTVTHTGTGYYAVKKTVTSDTSFIFGMPGGQTVYFAGGGLGTTDAYIGGYVTNVSRSESRSIVSHTDNVITIEGSITNWQDSDEITVYDSWSTIAGAEAQVFTDQGSTQFTANQIIDIGAGTWAETLTINNSLAANARYAMKYVGDNRNTIIDANGTLTRHALVGTTLHNHFEGFTFTGTCTGSWMFERGASISYYNLFENCKFDGDCSTHVMTRYLLCWFRDCEIDGSNGLTNIDGYGGLIHEFTRCKIHDLVYAAYYPTHGISIDACEIYNISGDVLRSATYSTGIGTHIIRNNTFYNCDRISGAYAAHRNLIFTNNICHTITEAVFFENGVDYKYDFGGSGVRINGNTYYNITKYLTSPSEGDITTFAAWQARNAALGNEVDSNERDPKFTNVTTKDFTLAADSPERNAGGYLNKGTNGVEFDAHYPDRGAWSSGTVSITLPARPTLTLKSVTSSTVTVTVDGDADATEYAELIDATGVVVASSSRTSDGDIELTLPQNRCRYKIIAYAENTNGYSKPSSPIEFIVSDLSTPTELLRLEVLSLLKSNTTITSTLGTDANGAVPIYTSGSFNAKTEPCITYTLLGQNARELSGSGRYTYELEIKAHSKSSSICDTLIDNIDYSLPLLKSAYTDWSIKRVTRGTESVSFSTEDGIEKRGVSYEIVVDKTA